MTQVDVYTAGPDKIEVGLAPRVAPPNITVHMDNVEYNDRANFVWQHPDGGVQMMEAW